MDTEIWKNKMNQAKADAYNALHPAKKGVPKVMKTAEDFKEFDVQEQIETIVRKDVNRHDFQKDLSPVYEGKHIVIDFFGDERVLDFDQALEDAKRALNPLKRFGNGQVYDPLTRKLYKKGEHFNDMTAEEQKTKIDGIIDTIFKAKQKELLAHWNDMYSMLVKDFAEDKHDQVKEACGIQLKKEHDALKRKYKRV